MFRQLVAAGVLDVEVEGFGGLRLSPSSRAVLRGEQPILLRKELPPKRGRAERGGGDRGGRVAGVMQAEHQPLFDALRDLRARLAREQNVPAYVIFHDSTLRGIAELRPMSLDALANVGGIGGTKLARYGEQVLETIREAG